MYIYAVSRARGPPEQMLQYCKQLQLSLGSWIVAVTLQTSSSCKYMRVFAIGWCTLHVLRCHTYRLCMRKLRNRHCSCTIYYYSCCCCLKIQLSHCSAVSRTIVSQSVQYFSLESVTPSKPRGNFSEPLSEPFYSGPAFVYQSVSTWQGILFPLVTPRLSERSFLCTLESDSSVKSIVKSGEFKLFQC